MDFIRYIPLFPLLGFLVNGFLGSRLRHVASGWVACGSVAISFFLSVLAFTRIGHLGASGVIVPVYDWIRSGTVHIPLAFLVDGLTAVMLLVVTGVGLLIHIYSTGYMGGDEGYSRYFAWLNLFIFFMLLLVMGSGYVSMFIGWEGVGLSSFLLIGFWFDRKDYNAAARKAFVMNRIGDLGFLLGIFLLFREFGSFEYKPIFSALAGRSATVAPSSPVLTWAAILLFIGAAGKSAQIPLYTWLPDAMAGPTPVSALIHAATMVTAGIYMVVRSNILYLLAVPAMDVLLVAGLATAVLAACIAITQNDIKKILAYSTVSQLGYMFMGLGAGSFSASIFHVITHAFFKALLFLGAGSVIHALTGEQDIRRMGGLSKLLPVTWMCMLGASLAISGVPPFSGFFSKDEILASVYRVSPGLWVLGVACSMLTAFYMFRMLFIAFGGAYRGTEESRAHLHEPGLAMTLPLVILGVLTVFGGLINLPPFFTGRAGWLETWLQPVLAVPASFQQGTREMGKGLEFRLMGISALASLIAIGLAWFRYGTKFVSKTDETIEREMGLAASFTRLSYHKFFIDEFYDRLISRPLNFLSDQFYKRGETRGIDRAVNTAGSGSMTISGYLGRLQSGQIRSYLLIMVIGIILVFVWAVFRNFA